MLPVIPSRMCLSFNMEAGGLRPFGSVLRLRALLEEKLATEEFLDHELVYKEGKDGVMKEI